MPYLYGLINSTIYRALNAGLGHVYFIPGAHHGSDFSFWMRADWLDELGLKEPTTLDELYNVMVAFKKKAGDGGTAMQVNLTGPVAYETFAPIFAAFGTSYRLEYLKVDSDKVSVPAVSENTLEALKYINKLYREGLINSDFASLKDAVDARNKYLLSGKAGMAFGSGAWLNDVTIAKIPGGKARIIGAKPVTTPGYNVFAYLQGVTNYPVTAISANTKDPKKLLEVIEYMNSREGRELMIAGIKGVHYGSLSAYGVYDRIMENYVKDYDPATFGVNIPWGLEFTTTVNGYIPVTEYKTFEEAYDNRQIFVEKSQASSAYNLKNVIKWGSAWSNTSYKLANVNIASVVDIRTKLNNDAIAVYFLKIITESDPSKIDGLWREYLTTAKNIGVDTYAKAYQDYYDANVKK